MSVDAFVDLYNHSWIICLLCNFTDIDLNQIACFLCLAEYGSSTYPLFKRIFCISLKSLIFGDIQDSVFL